MKICILIITIILQIVPMAGWRRSPIEAATFPANTMGSPTVSAASLEMAFETEGEKSARIFENGYNDLHLNGSLLTFRYFGNRLEHVRAHPEDFNARLAAIAEGVSRVESAFGTDLVSRVNILDVEGIHNAVTSRRDGEISFYIDAFIQEPIDELRVIAEHESLHRLVWKLDLSGTTELRKIFSELKGYDLFSNERFMLLTTGAVSEGSAQGGAESLLFDFIDERNFIPGMKGGHSSENIEEFCTSFMHSLMYIENLKDNLLKPILFHNKHSQWLSDAEKALIVEAYGKTMNIIFHSQSSQPWARNAATK